jgi:hypothetical protein
MIRSSRAISDTSSDTCPRRYEPARLNTLAGMFPASLLLIASVAKAISGSSEITNSPPIALHHALIMYEACLGSMLAAGVLARLVRWRAICTFGLFFVAGVHGFVSGDASCGCLGHWSPPVGVMLVVNAGAIISLRFMTPRIPTTGVALRSRLLCVTAIIVLVAITDVGMSFWRSSRSIDLDTNLHDVAPGSIVVLHPEDWIGRRLPLLGAIEIDADLGHGDWVVFVSSPGCARCDAVPMTVRGLRDALDSIEDSTQIAIVQIPPHRAPRGVHQQLPSAQGALNDDLIWIAEAPITLRLCNSVVTGTWSGELPSIDRILSNRKDRCD